MTAYAFTNIKVVEMNTNPISLRIASWIDDNSLARSNQDSFCTRILTKLRRWPWFIWFISIVEIIVFIAELGRSWSLTGSPIQIKPSFNPLIGPSAYVLIHMGARFAPCMYTIKEIPDSSFLYFPCPNYTGSTEERSCTLSEVCGFGGVSIPPNQWYRFIIPIFLHGGLIHIVVNVLTQLIIGIKMERKIGSLRLAIIYFASGIFGNVMSGNFAPKGSASVGCSSSLFGIIALFLLDMLFDWHNTSCCQLIVFISSIIIDLGLGLLPIIDNFGHIGGFIMGLLLGLVLFQPPIGFRRYKKSDREFSRTSEGRFKKILRNRPGKWWIWWILRFVILETAITIFVLSILNIYLWNVKCSWCQYINCLPIKNWCDTGHLTTVTSMNSVDTRGVDTTFLYTRPKI
jgi:membrane associated rhomboid family serine protease